MLKRPNLRLLAILTAFAMVCVMTSAAFSQQPARPPLRDEPLSYTGPEDVQREEPEGAMRVLSAICWYPVNRIVDITDIPRAYVTVGGGLGASARVTSLMAASWFEDDAYCLGWTKREPPFFGENVREVYFGFLAARAGEMDRDPTEIGASFHFLVVGANAAVSLGEFVDAVAGIVGVDLSGDDHGPMLFQDETSAE